ncbi:SOS response-associated peptidase [Nocardiopsis algeriensis]|uniref:Abasic site processing protein n=1 Tax=Nocardiopsis algeriensis TaxID=1478215 RepID=A0A841IN74_9ACTN|nr:SOS response-associated peptidase [Nocardiopsis algeriensis]MBB6118716.1 putative SOS response-associated peptidase YedK [Nocardiopsis algeriensis]
MCGRYAQSRNVHQLRLAFGLPEEALPGDVDPRAWPPLEELEPDYNISPGRSVYAVLGPPPQAAEPGPPGPRSLHTLRWGLIPSWAKDRNVGYRMINARSETIADKPSFRTAFRRRRCLLPADAYYEWQLIGKDGSAEPSTSPATDPHHRRRKAKADKKPWSVRYSGGEPLALAGIFERWRDPEADANDPGAWVWSCAVVTTEAAPELSHIHERMPVVVPPQDWARWLDPAAGPDELALLLEDTPAELLRADEVSTDVNSIKNNGPGLLLPLSESGSGEPDTLF